MSAQSMVYFDEMDSPIGALTISATERGICHIHFGTADFSLPTLKAWLKKQGIKGELVQNKEKISPIVEQLSEYFVGERHDFELPIDLYGTGFQKKVWEALRNIGYGETRSYKQIAQEIGAPKAVRAIGGANNQNPLPIIIPCHRVIGSNGAMVGYGGGLDKKEILLQMEGAIEKIS